MNLWFKEEWLNSDAGALGIYLALLYIRFTNWLSKSTIKNDVNKEIERLLSKEDRHDAWKSAKEFIDNVYSYYPTDEYGYIKSDDLIFDLDALEQKYWEKFKYACYKYLRYNIIKGYNKGKEIAMILRILRRVSKKIGSDKSICGSVKILSLSKIDDLLVEILSKEKKVELLRVKEALLKSGIIWFNRIIPAPYLMDEFLNNLERVDIIAKETNEIIAVKREKRVIKPIIRSKRLSREILELIVADVLEKFGFKVETNKIAKTKVGRKIEVDG